MHRIGIFAERLRGATSGTPALGQAADQLTQDVESALFDDLNAPEAIAALSVFITRANAELDRRGNDADALAKARAAFERVNGVLDVVPDAVVDSTLASWVEGQLEARKAARARRDFATADRIRAELEERDVMIEDTPSGTKWRVAR